MKFTSIYLLLAGMLICTTAFSQTETLIALADNPETVTTLEISPNPTKGLFKLSVNGLEEKENVQIEILNAYGNRIFLEKLGVSGSSLEYSFDIIAMKPGVYSVKVTQGDKVTIQKLIKQ